MTCNLFKCKYLMLFLIMLILGCNSKPTKIAIVNVFNVSCATEWNDAINLIKNTDKYDQFTINISESFFLQGTTEPTFGTKRRIEVTITGNNNIYLASNGHLLYVSSAQNVIINDTVFEGHQDNDSRLILVNGYNAAFTMQGNSGIKNNSGGGIHITNNAAFYMMNGEISGNAAFRGGGVLVDENSDFVLTNGIISDNIANNDMQNSGGGIFVRDSNFTISGGLITRNRSYNGGGVSCQASIFNMNGGIISHNSARIGGGVRLDNTTTTFSGGSVSDNVSSLYGGGIAIFGEVYYGAIFNMTGGVISGNVASSDGGGIYYSGGVFIFRAGIVYGNQETGESIELANFSGGLGASLFHSFPGQTVCRYGDGSNILPHIESERNYTDYIIIGRE